MISAYQYWMTETTPSTEVVVMLYDHALLQLHHAEEAMEQKRFDAVNASLLKAQRIVEELDCGLDHEKGGEIAENLHRLYDFVRRCLIDANLRKSSGPVREARQTVASLRDAWQSAVH